MHRMTSVAHEDEAEGLVTPDMVILNNETRVVRFEVIGGRESAK